MKKEDSSAGNGCNVVNVSLQNVLQGRRKDCQSGGAWALR